MPPRLGAPGVLLALLADQRTPPGRGRGPCTCSRTLTVIFQAPVEGGKINSPGHNHKRGKGRNPGPFAWKVMSTTTEQQKVTSLLAVQSPCFQQKNQPRQRLQNKGCRKLTDLVEEEDSQELNTQECSGSRPQDGQPQYKPQNTLQTSHQLHNIGLLERERASLL